MDLFEDPLDQEMNLTISPQNLITDSLARGMN
jgi:hypothetical protein